jgi:DNA-directed RNA polymerase subunit RPC12/RpoP
MRLNGSSDSRSATRPSGAWSPVTSPREYKCERCGIFDVTTGTDQAAARCPGCRNKVAVLVSDTSWNWLVVALIVATCVARFVSLDASPPGFYVDEAAHAMNAICIQQTGHDGHGAFMPLFSRALGEFTPPTLLYGEALWSTMFGTSITSFRAMAAFFSVLTIFGLFLLGSTLLDRQAGLFVALAGAVSPWSFHFSRIAWDPALAPCFLVFGAYFFLRSGKTRDALLASVALTLAMYAYGPQRVQVPLLVLLMLPLKARLTRVSLKWVAVVAVTMTVLLSPLAYAVVFGALQARFDSLSVFSASGSLPAALRLFVANFFRHFDAGFLWFTGDANLRHSTGSVGHWGWLNVLAVLAGAGYLAVALFNGRRVRLGRLELVLLFGGAAYLSGVIPAALTNEGIPHALRSIGCWPFLALFVGTIFWRLGKIQANVVPIICVVAAGFFSAYSWDYFVHYPRRAGDWFNADVKQHAETMPRGGDWARFKESFPPQFDLTRRYFAVRYGGYTCESSR